jgi:hypothetical protein
MKKNTLALLAAACACAVLPATAQTMKPGLWELSSKISSPDGQMQDLMAEMQKRLAAMPPDQRQQIQKMMEKNGVQLQASAGGALTTRMCMTREMIARREFPVQKGDCKQKVTPVSGNKMKVVFSCSKPALNGEGEMTVDSETSYRATMHTVTTNVDMQQALDVNAVGTWVGADCGTLRPMSVPQAR